MNKRFLLVLAAITVAFIGLIVMNKKDVSAPTTTEVSNHTYGEGKSGVTLVEYGDFQCPACLNYFPIVRQIKETYKEQITFQFRNFPIVSAHRNAMAAHSAAEAAAKQGKFWEMHDFLYGTQDSWKDSNNAGKTFEDYATELGLNIEQFRQDAASETTNAVIQADLKAGLAAGVKGTPAFFIDGKKYELEQLRSLEDFSKLIDEAIKQKSSS